MRAKDFQKLLPYCNYFVLQSHNISEGSNTLKIFDFNQSVEAVLEANKFSKSFLVALPTYSHFVKTNNGKIERIYSENFDVNLAKNTSTYTVVRASPIDVAQLRDTIANLKLKNYKGEIYYRLSSGNEISNWSMPTLVNVSKNSASSLHQKFEIIIERKQYIDEIFLHNTGNVDIYYPLNIRVSRQNNNVYAESVGDFILTSKKKINNSIKLNFQASSICFKIAPNERVKIGWMYGLNSCN